MNRLVLMVTAALVIGTGSAQAQMREWTDTGFLNISLGAQGGGDSFPEGFTFTRYAEPGRVEGTHDIGGGLLFDVSGGARVWRNMAVGVGLSRFSDESDVALNATVAHPLFFNRPRTATVDASGLKHTEIAFHIFAAWVLPVTDQIDVTFSGGPSFFSASQDVVGDITISEVGPPFTNVDVTPGVAEIDDSTVGVNVGVDLSYLATDNLGAGIFVRYAGGSVDLDHPNGERLSLDVGGVQFGVGVRLRF